MSTQFRPTVARAARDRWPTAAAMAIVAVAGGAWLWSARSFIAEDSYFYLVIARRLALEGEQSFSGAFPTNGFHPLWQYLLAGYARAIAAIEPSWLWRAAFAAPLSIALLGTAAMFLLRLERQLGLPGGTVTLPPLVFVSVLGVLYSEAHLLLALLAWTATLLVRAGDRPGAVSSWMIGAAAGLVVLARLDMVFLAMAILAWVWTGRRSCGFSPVVAAAAAALIVTPYLLSNWWLFSGVVPISGWLKSSFPLPTPTGFAGSGLSLSLSEYVVGYGVLPVCVSWLAAGLTRRRGAVHPVLVVFACGATGHMVYTMLFGSWSGWNWYYVLPVLTGAIAVGSVLRTLGDRGRIVALAQSAVLLLVAGAGLLYMVGRDNRSPVMQAVQQYLSSPGMAGRTVFVSELPGEAAFLGRANIIAADFLTANRRLYRVVTRDPDPWGALRRECVRAGHPIDEIVYVGGAFVAREGDRLVWLDPRVSSRRAMASIVPGTPRIERSDVPFVVWDVADDAGELRR